MSHVQIDNEGSKNWLVIGMSAPMVSSSANATFNKGCGCGVIAAEKHSNAIKQGYCKSYNVHLCFLTFCILIHGENCKSMLVTDDAGDCRECIFDRSFLR